MLVLTHNFIQFQGEKCNAKRVQTAAFLRPQRSDLTENDRKVQVTMESELLSIAILITGLL